MRWIIIVGLLLAGCDDGVGGDAEPGSPAYATCEDAEGEAPCCTSLDVWQRLVGEDGHLDCPEGYELRKNAGEWGVQHNCERHDGHGWRSAGGIDWTSDGGLEDYLLVRIDPRPGPGQRVLEHVGVVCDLDTGRARWVMEQHQDELPGRQWCFADCWDQAGCEELRQMVALPPVDCADLN